MAFRVDVLCPEFVVCPVMKCVVRSQCSSQTTTRVHVTAVGICLDCHS